MANASDKVCNRFGQSQEAISQVRARLESRWLLLMTSQQPNTVSLHFVPELHSLRIWRWITAFRAENNSCNLVFLCLQCLRCHDWPLIVSVLSKVYLKAQRFIYVLNRVMRNSITLGPQLYSRLPGHPKHCQCHSVYNLSPTQMRGRTTTCHCHPTTLSGSQALRAALSAVAMLLQSASIGWERSRAQAMRQWFASQAINQYLEY